MSHDFAADIPYSVAQAAHSGTSFVPEKRAASEIKGYAEELRQVYDLFRSQIVGNAEKESLFEAEFARFRAGYRAYKLKYLYSSARCVSSFIAGPSKFPVARMNKRASIAHKRLNEMLDFKSRAIKAIRKKLFPERAAIKSSDADACERLENKIEDLEREQEQMKAANVVLRKHFKQGEGAMVGALVSIGFTETDARKIITPNFCGRIGFSDYQLKNNNANIRRLKARLETISRNQATPNVEKDGANARIEDAAAENRVRLFFPGKPDEHVRAKLKSHGFRWTPSLGCWQAYRNHTSLLIANQVAGVA